jgi:prolyl-tRNA editing enzyme YbaK/EbsC (Cys-tRNA(Pro) deacylase)
MSVVATHICTVRNSSLEVNSCDNGVMSEIEQQVLDVVKATGVPFESLPCDPDLADTAAFCEHYGFSLEDSANTIVVASKGESPVFAACVVLATHRLDVNGMVRKRLGVRKVSFAPPELTADVTGMVMGGVTPFGLPEDLPLWIDAAVMERQRIVVGGGSRALKIIGSPGILTALGHAEVIDGLARPSV